jgi:hypothetical protein
MLLLVCVSVSVQIFWLVVPSLQVRLRLGLVVELFQGRVAMDTCMDVNEFHHVCEVDHEGTMEKFGQIIIPDQYIGLHWY